MEGEGKIEKASLRRFNVITSPCEVLVEVNGEDSINCKEKENEDKRV